MTGTSDLERLIAGLGTIPGPRRFLHYTDHGHIDTRDEALIASQSIQRALLAGGYRNVILESSVETNEHPNMQAIIAQWRAQGLNLYFPDARFGLTLATVRERVGEREAEIMDQHYSVFLNMLYRQGPALDSVAEYQSYLQDYINARNVNGGPRITASASELARAFERVRPYILQYTFDRAANQDSIENIVRYVSAPERDDHNTFVMYGVGHYDGEDRRLPDMDSGALQGLRVSPVFPGPDAAELMRNLRRSDTPPYRAAVDDPPDFIFDVAANRIIENRPPDQRQPTLEAILAQGDTALLAQRERPRTASVDEPVTEEEEITVTIPEDAAGHGDIPWGGLIGGAIGAWLTSTLGQGPFSRAIFMVIGGLIGWLLGGSIGRNLGRSEEDAGSPETALTNADPELANAVALSQANLIPTLAFANVSSVSGTLAMSDANPAELLDSPALFPIAAVDDILSQAPTTLH